MTVEKAIIILNHMKNLITVRIYEEEALQMGIDAIEKLQELKEKGCKHMTNETIENNAYLWSCKCPVCGKKKHRGSEEKTFYCEQCGSHLHQRAFTEKELEDASFQRHMDDYED